MSTAIRKNQIRSEKARVTQPKPGKTRPRGRVRERVPGEYNPRIASRGLTRDTPFGPVDEVALDRAMDGRGPISLTWAERTELIDRLAALPPAVRLPSEPSLIRTVAEAIGAHRDWLAKRVYARRAVLRAAGLYPAKPEGAGHG
jgi:hypothetical protein